MKAYTLQHSRCSDIDVIFDNIICMSLDKEKLEIERDYILDLLEVGKHHASAYATNLYQMSVFNCYASVDVLPEDDFYVMEYDLI